jgi:hypothetical protein
VTVRPQWAVAQRTIVIDEPGVHSSIPESASARYQRDYSRPIRVRRLCFIGDGAER